MSARTNRDLLRPLMRRIFLLSAAFTIAFTAQAQEIKLPPGTYSVDDVFREVSDRTGYRFAVNTRFDRTRTVRFTTSPATVGELLDAVLADSGYTYEIRGRYVMIKADPDGKQYVRKPAAESDIDPWGPKIYYFVIDKTQLLRDYSTNRGMLDALDMLLRDPDVYGNIDSIIVTAAASPIASPAHNAKLAIGRAEALASYIRWQHPQVDRARIYSYPMGIDWEGFWSLIENNPGVPSRNQILNLRYSANEDVMLEMLRSTGGKGTYNYLLNTVYPKLQYAAVRVVLKDGRSIPAAGSPLRRMVEPEVKYDTVYFERIVYDTVRIITPVPVPVEVPVAVETPVSSKKPFYIALKTNLLADVALVPNIGFEIPFGRNYRWSFGAEGYWAWWNTKDPRWWYYRVQMVEAELRWWFGNRTGDPMHGWYIGAYGYGGTYDFRLFTDSDPELGQLSDFTWSAGLSIGYAMPLSRRLNMEFGLGFGYLGGEYKKYYRSSCEPVFPWVSTHERNWFGPTKAKVSLVWQIGSGVNSNYKKKEK